MCMDLKSGDTRLQCTGVSLQGRIIHQGHLSNLTEDLQCIMQSGPAYRGGNRPGRTGTAQNARTML